MQATTATRHRRRRLGRAARGASARNTTHVSGAWCEPPHFTTASTSRLPSAAVTASSSLRSKVA